MKVSHLVTVGCSWTFCQGLEDPKTQGWPALLAKKLDVPVVNLALPGIGNDAIHRRTYEYFFEDLPNNNNPLYIVAWSQLWRREAWCKQYYSKNMHGYNPISFATDLPQNPYEQAILDNWSPEDFLRRTTLFRLSLISLFENNNTPFVETFFSDDKNEASELVEAKFPGSTNYLKENKFRARDLYLVSDPYPSLPCGHDGYEAMPVVADYLFDFIETKHGKIESVQSPYLSLKEFHLKEGSGTTSYWE